MNESLKSLENDEQHIGGDMKKCILMFVLMVAFVMPLSGTANANSLLIKLGIDLLRESIYGDNGSIKDFIPKEQKDEAIESLKEKGLIAEIISPMEPIRIGEKGMVFPYQMKGEIPKTGQKYDKMIILFVTVYDKNEAAYRMKKYKITKYESYVNNLETKGMDYIRMEMVTTFPDYYTISDLNPINDTTPVQTAEPTHPKPTIEERITKLNDLKGKGLLNQEEYDKKKAEILDGL